jgi:hypothetical protein
MKDPVEFLRSTFPAIFSKGISILRKRGESGDELAARQLNDICAVRGCIALHFDDRSPVFLGVCGGEIIFSEQMINGSEVKIVAQVAGEALSILLGRAVHEGALDDDEVAVGAASIVSKRLEDLLAERSITFNLIVNGVPDLGQVNAVIGFNVSEVPANPSFSAEVAFSDLQLAQEGQTNLQELFMGGKLKMQGDYSTALQIAVQMMTNPI